MEKPEFLRGARKSPSLFWYFDTNSAYIAHYIAAGGLAPGCDSHSRRDLLYREKQGILFDNLNDIDL